MAKRKSPTKIEKFYIESNPEGKTVDELADELGLYKAVVERILLEQAENTEVVEEEKAPPKTNHMTNKIINKTAGKGVGGVAIFSSAASERVDDMLKTTRPKQREGVTKTYPDRD